MAGIRYMRMYGRYTVYAYVWPVYGICVCMAGIRYMRMYGRYTVCVYVWQVYGKESTCQCRTHKKQRFDFWVVKIPWSRMAPGWHPTPVVSSEKFHGQRSLAGYSPWGHKELDMTKDLNTKHLYMRYMIYCKNWLM